jgi:hypothetical protein
MCLHLSCCTEVIVRRQYDNLYHTCSHASTHTHTEMYSCKLLALLKRNENHWDFGVGVCGGGGGVVFLKIKFVYYCGNEF